LKYFKHVVRADGLEKTVMLGMGEGQRSRDRLKTSWLDGVTACLGLTLGKAAQQERVASSSHEVGSRGRPRPDGTR